MMRPLTTVVFRNSERSRRSARMNRQPSMRSANRNLWPVRRTGRCQQRDLEGIGVQDQHSR